ncbi:MAG TPA: bifunctional helix-turn-helix domain-containing protein/methylated-DNA--[protein]-cysteine S-methyltransferase [Aestuariivirgaceae bacterium]|nr:bifunctional helix-turn-helix domain-containing protein/methylated-DNA--[protein]-cysteine S-methyltransferase [Aestuariivirgaceae bacterium]
MLELAMNNSQSDYSHVRKALAFISENWRDQPSLEAIAAEVRLSPSHLQRVFSRWAGLSPKEFLQAVTLDHARAMLRSEASVLDTAYEVGLSGPSRLHDLFVTHEGMTPGAFKLRGRGLTIEYGFHPCPFGSALVMAAGDALVGLAFADEGGEAASLADMKSRWPEAAYVENSAKTAGIAARIFNPDNWQSETPLKVVFIGTDFEIRVWETLLRIPLGRASTYSDIAIHLGKPKAARAVGAAVGRNPVSFVVPCHRVLGKSGGLCGYHWGLTRKRAILGWEAGLAARSP